MHIRIRERQEGVMARGSLELEAVEDRMGLEVEVVVGLEEEVVRVIGVVVIEAEVIEEVDIEVVDQKSTKYIETF